MNESRIKELINWLDDKAADTSMPYREMANYRDVSTAMRQITEAEQDRVAASGWRIVSRQHGGTETVEC